MRTEEALGQDVEQADVTLGGKLRHCDSEVSHTYSYSIRQL